MSNRTMGRIAFEAGGKPYALHYTINALCLLEDELGEGVDLGAVMQKLGDAPSFRTIRLMFLAGMRAENPDVTAEQAGNVIDLIGLKHAAELIAQAITAAFAGGDKAAPGPLAATPAKAAG